MLGESLKINFKIKHETFNALGLEIKVTKFPDRNIGIIAFSKKGYNHNVIFFDDWEGNMEHNWKTDKRFKDAIVELDLNPELFDSELYNEINKEK